MSDQGSSTRVVAVMSSARVDGNTATLVRAALAGAEAEGAQTPEIVLPRYRIGFCQGCLRCMGEGRCATSDDFEAIRALLCDADGVILSSPTYGGAPSAMLKNLVDSLGLFEYFTSSSFGGKYVVGMSTANRAAAAKKVARDLARLLTNGVFQRGYAVGHLGVSSREKGVAADSGALQRAQRLGRQLAQEIRSGRKHRLQNPVGRLVNTVILKPSFRTAIIDHRESMMKGVYENLNRRGLLA